MNQDIEELKARVAALEVQLIEFADYVDLRTSCDRWRYEDEAIERFNAVWKLAKEKQIAREKAAMAREPEDDLDEPLCPRNPSALSPEECESCQ